MKAPLSSAVIVVSSPGSAREAMLSPLQEADSLLSCNLAENQRAKHRDRIRRRAVEMPGGFSRGVEAGHRPFFAQHFRIVVGRKSAEGIGDGADQGIAEKRRFCNRSCPVRFRRL